MNQPLPFFTAAICALLVFVAPVSAKETQNPNIIVILADDMGIDSVSANNDAMGLLKTPHIDHLVSEGINFTDAHSGSAVCTPTRYGLLTGRYCWRTALKKEVLWDYGRPLIEPERLTVAELLRDNGYTTGMIGKWHLGFDWYDKNGKLANDKIRIDDAIWKPEEQAQRIRDCAKQIDFSKKLTGGPTDHGFEHYYGVDLPNMPPYAWIDQDQLTAIPSVQKPKEMSGSDGPMVPGWQLEDILPTLGRKSADWITQQSKADKPFFLYVSLTSPHTPISPSKPFQGKSVSPYADFLIETDAVVGQIIAALKTANIEDNTLLIFTADNGTASACKFAELKKHGIDLQHNFRASKGSIYEGGHRVPFIVRWPGRVSAGTQSNSLLCLNDFMATVADLLNQPLPDDAAEDSTSFLPLLRDPKAVLKDRPMVVHHDYNGGFAIRDQRWKLVGDELYDMQADAKESTDLSKQHPDIVKKMRETLEHYQHAGRSRSLTK